MRTHYLIDADSMIYKAGCGNETRWWEAREVDRIAEGVTIYKCQYKKELLELCKDDPRVLVHYPCKEAGPLNHSIGNLNRIMEQTMDGLNMSGSTVFIGGDNNFRYDIYPEYKGNRDKFNKPVHEQQLRDHLINKYGAIVVHGEEVDDRVSWLQCTAEPETTSIASIDKDLNNTPGWHYNYDNNVEYYVSPAEADLNFWRQMISGDRTDNIPGLPRCGKVAAEYHLPESLPYWDMEQIVWNLYQKLEFDTDYFILQGRLLWMRRKKNEMWEPAKICTNSTGKMGAV